MKQIFITGTDTGVGKTVVSAILTAGLEANYWKPIQCGLQEQTDTEFVCATTRLPEDHFSPETFRLSHPLSPHAAAEQEGVHIDLDAFRLPDMSHGRTLIVEGAGGLLVPLNRDFFVIDLIKKLDVPVVLVARSSLGTINHTLMSLHVLKSYGLQVLGVVMNGPRNKGNKDAIETYGRVKVLAEIEPISQIDSVNLSGYFQHFDSMFFT